MVQCVDFLFCCCYSTTGDASARSITCVAVGQHNYRRLSGHFYDGCRQERETTNNSKQQARNHNNNNHNNDKQQTSNSKQGKFDHLARYGVVAERRVARVRVLESHAPPQVNGVFGGHPHRAVWARELHLLNNEGTNERTNERTKERRNERTNERTNER